MAIKSMATLESCLYFCLILVAQDPRHMSTCLHPPPCRSPPLGTPLKLQNIPLLLPLNNPLTLSISPPPSPPLPKYLTPFSHSFSPPLSPLPLNISPSPSISHPLSHSFSSFLPQYLPSLSPLISPSPSQYLPFSFPLPTHIIICLSSIVL